MGSLRNPIGPLPSSIYWRRRAVALCVVALLILLTLWAVSALGGGDGDGDGTDPQGKGQPTGGPASSITPGPTDDPSATISQRPGGRDEVTDDPTGDSGGAEKGTEGSSGGGDGDEGQAGSDGGGDDAGGTDGGSPGGGGQLPADSPLPTCGGSGVSLTLRTAKDSYAPEARPRIDLTVRNTGGSDCKVDFGPRAAVVSITDVDGDTVWSSAHCPAKPGAAMTRVPGGDAARHSLTWDRKPSAAGCATPRAGAVAAGTYLVKAELGGGLSDQTSFVLTGS